MIKNLIFDVDGTLWDSTGVVARAWKQALEERGYSSEGIDADRLKKEFGLPMDIIAEHLFTECKDRESRNELLELCCRYEHEHLEALTEDISYPEMRSSLEELSGSFGLFIVSNCQLGYIPLVLKKNRISHIIRDYLCFGDTGLEKGQTIRCLMEKNKLSPEETVYIGDTEGDRKAAMAAGIPFIYAAYGFGNLKEGYIFKVESLSELKNQLSGI